MWFLLNVTWCCLREAQNIFFWRVKGVCLDFYVHFSNFLSGRRACGLGCVEIKFHIWTWMHNVSKIMCCQKKIYRSVSNNNNNNNVTVLPIVIGTHVTIFKGLMKRLEDMEIWRQVETIQTTGLRSVEILRRVRRTWRSLLSLKTLVKKSFDADVKTLKGE